MSASQIPSRLETSKELKNIMSERTGRITTALGWVIGVGEHLRSQFDDLFSKEIPLLQKQLDLFSLCKDCSVYDGHTIGEVFELIKQSKVDVTKCRKGMKDEVSKRLNQIGYWDYVPIP